MTDDTPLPFDLSAIRRKKLTVDFGGGNQSSDGGLLLLRHAERKLGICERLADAMPDRRDARGRQMSLAELPATHRPTCGASPPFSQRNVVRLPAKAAGKAQSKIKSTNEGTAALARFTGC
jgi:Transposase DDE domain group 1